MFLRVPSSTTICSLFSMVSIDNKRNLQVVNGTHQQLPQPNEPRRMVHLFSQHISNMLFIVVYTYRYQSSEINFFSSMNFDCICDGFSLALVKCCSDSHCDSSDTTEPISNCIDMVSSLLTWTILLIYFTFYNVVFQINSLCFIFILIFY